MRLEQTMEPELTQAVRIVLKYEIQSLLSRLSETGEEYIVLTASADENTCGHIGSAKAESFVQVSSVQSVKQQFLNFCTGKENGDNSSQGPSSAVPNVLEPPQLTAAGAHSAMEPSTTAMSSATLSQVAADSLANSKPHRRKSTPRHKVSRTIFQDSPSTRTPEIGSPIEERSPSSAHATEPLSQPMESAVSSCALDLSDKTGGYAYTLEQAQDGNQYSNGPVMGTVASFLYNDAVAAAAAAIKANEFIDQSQVDVDKTAEFLTIEPKNYKNEWTEERFDLATNQIVKNESQYNEVGFENNFPGKKDIGQLKSKFHVAKNAVAADGLSGLISSAALPFTHRDRSFPKVSFQRAANRRKVKRGPKKHDLSAQSKSSIAMNVNNNEVPNEAADLIKGVVIKDKKPGNSLVSITPSVRNQKGKKGLDIYDMKSAFEEIGNMAKCLICNKILANKNNRTFHWRSHVGDKRYECDICHKAFTHPSNMRSHRKIHTDEKPFPCDLCDRRFRRRDYLLQHLERFHYNPKSGPSQEPSAENSASATGSESNTNSPSSSTKVEGC